MGQGDGGLMQAFTDRAGNARDGRQLRIGNDILFREFTPCRPATLYGACKHGTQLLLDARSRQTGLSSAWGRIFFSTVPVNIRHA